jgi:hypothetical protein
LLTSTNLTRHCSGQAAECGVIPLKMKTYKENTNQNQDFEVKYRLYGLEDGGRKATFQHLRCDFSYEEDDIDEIGIYMIWPEFLDSSGKPINDKEIVPLEGEASMWIVVDEMREKVHRRKIKVGTKGFFMEGLRRIGEVKVTRIVDLNINER